MVRSGMPRNTGRSPSRLPRPRLRRKLPRPRRSRRGKTHAEKQKVENAFFFRIDGKDKQGHAASFDFIILTNEYTWVKGSTSEVVSGGKVIPEEEVADRVLTQQVRDFACKRERPDRRRPRLRRGRARRRRKRARIDRAKTVVGWITKVAKPEIALWTLDARPIRQNACKQQEDADSSFERPVIFAGVR